MRTAAPGFSTLIALWVAIPFAPAQGWGDRTPAVPEVEQRAAASETADLGLAKKILRLTDVEIDRFLTNADEGKKETELPGALDEAEVEEHTRIQAMTLVKRVSKNLRAVGQTLVKFEGGIREQWTDQGLKVAEIERLQREINTIEDKDARESEIMKLRAQNKELMQDKEGLVKTMQTMLGQTQPGKPGGVLNSAKSVAKKRAAELQKKFQKRIQNLEVALANEKINEKVLAEELEAAKQRNQDAKTLVGRANATNDEMSRENVDLQHTLDQIQDENDSLIADKGQLMGTLRSLLTQNADLQKQVTTAKRALGMQSAKKDAFQLSVGKSLRRMGSPA